MASLLCICDQGYRASVEEQDDTVVWMAHMLQKCEGTQVSLLLRGSAINYAAKSQKSVPVKFGEWTQSHPADFPRDLGRFNTDGGRLFVLASDIERYGLTREDLISQATPIDADKIAGLVDEHDNVSFW